MPESDHLDSDPRLDAQLAVWGQSLRRDEERLQRMKAALLSEFASDRPLPPAFRAKLQAKDRPRPSGWTLVPVALCLGIAGWLLLSPAGWNRASQRSIAFTPDDVRSRENLVCELERVFEHQLVGVRQRGETVSVDTDSESRNGEAPTLVLRFVLQDRLAGVWTTVDQEEVMGPADDQFRFASPARLEIECWSHLLPDQSLWLESVVSPFGGKGVRMAGQFQINLPQELWSVSRGPLQRRVLVVYQMLNPCSGEVI